MSQYGYFIRFTKPQIQSYFWLKYFRPQNQLSGAAPRCCVSLSPTEPADGFVFPPTGTVSLI